MDKASVAVVIIAIVVFGIFVSGAELYVTDPCRWSHSEQYCQSLNNIPSGYTQNSDGTYCPTGYPYYDPSTGTCYEQPNNSGRSNQVYSPTSQTGWSVQVVASDHVTCTGNSCQCSQPYQHTYTGVTDYGYASSPGNGIERSEPGYQYPQMGPYETLSDGQPFPASAYGVAVIDHSGAREWLVCMSSFWSNSPPV